MTTNDKPWITPVVKIAIQNRWNAYRGRDFSSFLYWKERAKDLITRAKANWAKRANEDTKQLWRVANETRGTKSSDPIATLYNSFPSANDAAEAINNYFSSVFTPHVERHSTTEATNTGPWNISISVSDVETQLRNLNPSKAFGNDGIPTILYKSASRILAAPLCHLFNQSIVEKKFPVRWKRSIISPVPKISNPTITDIRPISLLPVPSKILEKLVFRSADIYQKFMCNFGRAQFGSVPGSSTTTALLKIQHDIASTLEQKGVTGVLLLAYDYSKAFDVLGHHVILNRLEETGFPADFVAWSTDYLSDRMHATRVRDQTSPFLPVTSGIPQGSVLGPAFYCLVAGSLDTIHNRSGIIKYIDDTTIYAPILQNETGQEILDEHAHMLQWSNDHGLPLNTRKCKSIFFRRTSSVHPPTIPGVTQVTELKILGVTVQDDLRWNSHIDNVISSSSKRLYALRILAPLLSTEDLLKIYYGLIRSTLEYASPVFVSLPLVQGTRLESLQKRAHRLICKFSRTDEQCQCSNFPSLSSRRLNASVKLYNLALSSGHHCLRDIIPSISARTGLPIQPPCRTTRFRQTFIPIVTARINGTVII